MFFFKKRLLFYLIVFSIFTLSIFSQDNISEARKKYDERNYTDAIVILQKDYEKEPYNLSSSLLLVDSYIKVKNYLNARLIVDTLKKYHSKNVSVLEKELELNLIENRNVEARASVSTILKLDNKNYYATYADGVLNERMGYINAASTIFEKARIIDAKRSEATVAFAYLKISINPELALKLFRENLNNNPRMPESYYNLANYYYITKNYNMALTEIEPAFFYYKNYTEALKLKAEILSSLKRYNEAITIFETIPESFFKRDKYYYIGTVYEEAKNYEKAKESYILFLRENPESELARLAYERVLYYTNPKVNTERDRASLYYAQMAAYYARIGDTVKSISYYKHILTLNPANTYARTSLADLYKTMGYPEKSFEEISIAYGINPNDKTLDYRYQNDKRLIERTVPSKAWGINQYMLKSPGYTVAIADTILSLKDTPRMFSTAIYEELSFVLPQYKNINVVSIYTNKLTEAELYNNLISKNIDFYFKGSVSSKDDAVILTLDLVDVKSFETVTNFSVMTSGKEKMINASVMASRYISTAIPFYASVVKINNGDIYINAGRWQGVTNNATFAVYNTDKAFYNINKNGIDKPETDIIGIIKIDKVDENVSMGRLIDTRALRYIKANQIVVPYKAQ